MYSFSYIFLYVNWIFFTIIFKNQFKNACKQNNNFLLKLLIIHTFRLEDSFPFNYTKEFNVVLYLHLYFVHFLLLNKIINLNSFEVDKRRFQNRTKINDRPIRFLELFPSSRVRCICIRRKIRLVSSFQLLRYVDTSRVANKAMFEILQPESKRSSGTRPVVFIELSRLHASYFRRFGGAPLFCCPFAVAQTTVVLFGWKTPSDNDAIVPALNGWLRQVFRKLPRWVDFAVKFRFDFVFGCTINSKMLVINRLLVFLNFDPQCIPKG